MRACWRSVLALTGYVVYPRIDAVRSGRAFTDRVEQASAGIAELALVGAKEQYLLELDRPTFNFGHARWREWQERGRGCRRLAGRGPAARRADEQTHDGAVLPGASAVDLGRANQQYWFLVTGSARPGLRRVGRPRPARGCTRRRLKL